MFEKANPGRKTVSGKKNDDRTRPVGLNSCKQL